LKIYPLSPAFADFAISILSRPPQTMSAWLSAASRGFRALAEGGVIKYRDRRHVKIIDRRRTFENLARAPKSSTAAMKSVAMTSACSSTPKINE
jgi:hypothetical protein